MVSIVQGEESERQWHWEVAGWVLRLLSAVRLPGVRD